MTVQKRALIALSSLMLCSAACSGTSTPQSGTGPNSGFLPMAWRSAYASPSGIGKHIKHVVIIVQENRSFDNIFAGYPNADAPTYGYDHKGRKVVLKAANFGVLGVDVLHTYHMALTNYNNGQMNGFDENIFKNKQPAGLFPYAVLKRDLVQPYWDMAQQYALADHMFPTVWGNSFTAHLDLIAATTIIKKTAQETISEIDTPINQAQPNWTCAATPPPPTTLLTYTHSNGVIKWEKGGPPPCFTQFRTMKDTLDAKKVSWKYYAPTIYQGGGGNLWSSFGAIKNVFDGPDWKANVISPENSILTDVPHGKLPAVTWVIPNDTNSDHEGSGSDTGPSWVAAVVNTIGTSKFWDSTAIFVVWDDWGGWYDDVKPPQLDYLGLAIRVPCIIISPYAKLGYVSHTQYEFGSILKFVEEAFNVPSLGYTDARANSPSDSFDFLQKPHPFATIPAKYPTKYFEGQKEPNVAPDDD